MGYGWGRDRRCDGALEDYVLAAIDEIRDVIRIHPGRIFLAGVCEGASLAYRLGLSFPATFAGVVALNGWLPPGPLPLTFPVNRMRSGDGPSIFIGHGLSNPAVPVAKAEKAYQLLYAAGLAVELRMYSASHGITAGMLRDVDRWLMQCCQV
jgi:phospholipase/carboxylesterase